MENYSVKQIADMLNTQPETVRRWIRAGKLRAEQSSRKDGNVITEKDLNKFLKSSPKYAGIIAGTAVGALAVPIAAMPLVGGMAATYLAMSSKEKSNDSTAISKDNVKKYLQDEIIRRELSIKQKSKTMEHIKQEIEIEQKQVAEYRVLLKQMEDEENV